MLRFESKAEVANTRRTTYHINSGANNSNFYFKNWELSNWAKDYDKSR